MAGLLASEMFRRESPCIYEAQPDLPDNHGALLRFRSDIVARETKQTFRRVSVLTAVKSRGQLRTSCTLKDLNQYAVKVSGTIAERSVMNLEACERYIAPPNFLERLAHGKNIVMNTPFTRDGLETLKGQRDVATLSTIPMPVMMQMAGWDYTEEDFSCRPISSVTATLIALRVDVFQTIYYPDPAIPFYRASITGNQLIIEYMRVMPPDLGYVGGVLDDFGIPPHQHQLSTIRTRHQKYGKLVAANASQRQAFILAMTDEYNVYSVGRFATWRQLLLDDVVGDVHKVHRMITERSGYLRHLKRGTVL